MKIAVSACLLGEPCRYDGGSRPCEDVLALGERHELVPVCPEVMGGLAVPHPPCEIALSEHGLRVVDEHGSDMTGAFVAGAAKALEVAQQEQCAFAVLKAKSPSCGSGLVYDGSFSGRLVPGFGVAARLFREAGICVVDEQQVGLLRAALRPSDETLQEGSRQTNVPDEALSVNEPLPADDALTCDAEGSSVQSLSKSELILGEEGVARLAASTVMVLGLGGVGSNCVEALARGGVGRLIVVDHDVVQESNINRQAIAYHSTIGRKKAEVVAAMVRDINPRIVVEPIDMFVLRENIEQLLGAYEGQLDYVIDAIDTVSTKLALAELADKQGFRLISSMGAANKLQPENFHIADLYDTVNCPLCRIMRKEGRKRGIRQLRVLYSSEQPVDVPSREGATRKERSNLGTMSYAPPIMGQMIAGDVIRTLSGVMEQAESCEEAPPEAPSRARTLQDGTLFDMHCHLDFAGDPAQAAADAAERGICALSATVTPGAYETAAKQFEPYGNVAVGLGLHPWWIADGSIAEDELLRFTRLAGQTRVIAEVGLDFSKGRENSRQAQVDAFERVLDACRAGGKLISLHASASAGTVLDLLERYDTLQRNACVFHWFSGTSDELRRAIGAGCFFSVGQRMLATKRGRAYAKAIPTERLLLETDEPSRPKGRFTTEGHQRHLQQALAELEALRGEPLAQRIAVTSKKLLLPA